MDLDLFTYPMVAGSKEHSTSRDAAIAIEASGKAATLRVECLNLFKSGFRGTADECAHKINEDILSIRPRIAELHKRGLIEKTGNRRNADGGRPSHEWQLA